MSGRRAALGVAFKTARRNKKRTLFLVLLIALPVLVAVATSAIVRLSHVTPEERVTSEFGAGDVLIQRHLIEPGGSSSGLGVWVDDTVDDIAPGAERLHYRADHTGFYREFGRITDLDLSNPLSEGLLALVDGRAPSGSDEVVLTEHLAAAMEVGIGDTIELEAGDGGFEVVGLASHPILWNVNEAVLSSEGQDRHLAGSDAQPVHTVILDVEDDAAFGSAFWTAWERDKYQFYPEGREWPMPERYNFMWEGHYAAMSEAELVEVDRLIEEEGPGEEASAYVEGLFASGVPEMLPDLYAETRTERLSWDRTNIAETGPVIGTGVAALILAEVAFIAGAAFATGTRRRLREIGLMGANGASTSHVRTSVVGEGLVVGLVGGLAGSVAAFLVVTLGSSVIQRFVDRRIDGFPFSLLDIVGPITVAVVSCAIAAWVPARTAAGVPTLTALQGRMPVAAPKRWVIPVGLGLGAFGVLLLGVGLAGGNGGAGAVAVIGAVFMIGGAALLAGPLVAWISKHAERFPITSRIVLRDSGRQRGRAAAAVAATIVILMAPIAVMATLEQNEASQAIHGLEPTHPQVWVYGSQSDTGEMQQLEDSDIAAIRSAVPGGRVAALDAMDVPVRYPAELEAGPEAEARGEYYLSSFRVAVANDELLAIFDNSRLETALTRDRIALVGVEERETTVEIDGERMAVTEVPMGAPRWEFPRVVVTADYAERFAGTETRPSALVEVEESWSERLNPLSEPARPLWELGLFTNGGGADMSNQTAFVLVFLATMLVVLIVVATITALSAAEADNDLQTVVAVGATNSIRRRYLGLQSGIHTLLGCLLAVPLTLLLMKTAYSSTLGGYTQVGAFGVFDSAQLFVPWAGIGVLVAGLPLAIGFITTASVRSARTTPPRRAT